MDSEKLMKWGIPALLLGVFAVSRRGDDHPMPLRPTRPSDDTFKRPSRRRRRRVSEDDFFNADGDEDEGEEFVVDVDDHDCPVCGREFEINKIGMGLVQHFLKESDYNTLGWKSKSNPEGVRRTARNIAGEELFVYGHQALAHYLQEGKRSKVFEQVVMLLRASLVPQVLAGDVVNFIELLDIDDVDDEPRFERGFADKWESEDFFLDGEVFNHEDHDEIDELIEDLDKLTAFCISFLHDGAYGGESLGREDMGDGLEEERVRYVEGSIELKFVYEDGENILIRASYTNETDGPVIYLPPARFIKNQPDNPRGGVHEH